MRLRFPLFALGLVLAAAAAAPSAGPASSLAPPTQIFVLAGQSNMDGRGFPLSQGEPSDPRLLLWRNGGWQVASDPLADPGYDENGVGPGMTFGLQTLSHLPGSSIGLIMCAVGGTSIAQWQPGGALLTNCLSQAHAAGGTVYGFLFLQGETDAEHEQAAQTWSESFKRVATAFRSDLGLTVPIVLGQIGKLRNEEFPFQSQVRSQQAAAAASIPKTVLVTTMDQPMQPDKTHFTIPAYKVVGARFAAAWWQLTGGGPPTPGPSFSIDATPPSLSVSAGQAASYAVAYAQLNGFSGAASLSANGLPAGATAKFSPSTLPSAGSSQLTVQTSAATPPGTYPLTISGTSNSLRRSDKVNLVVVAAAPDFALSVKPAFAVAPYAQASTLTYRLKVGSKNGFAGALGFAVSGLPTGASAVFKPAGVTLSAGQSTRVDLQVAPTAATQKGTYPLHVTVTGGGLTHGLDATLIVK